MKMDFIPCTQADAEDAVRNGKHPAASGRRNGKGARCKRMVRRHIVFYGSVQGVGFRWRAEKAADMFRCTGWCRNEWDGSVTMEIQGREEDIDQVILHVETSRYVRIENMRVKDLPVIEGERYFITE